MTTVRDFDKPHPTLIQWVEDYLTERGLTLGLVTDKYGFEMLAATTLYRRLGWEGIPRHLGGLWITPRQPSGDPYPNSGHAIMWTIQGVKEKRNKAGSNHPSFFCSAGGWDAMAEDDYIVVCESALKAAVVNHVSGWPTVGLNGVDGWSMGKSTPHRDLINQDMWEGRNVIVLYDSFSTVKEKSYVNVKRAREDCEEALSALGEARLYRVELPQIQPSDKYPTGQWGVDDFVKDLGAEALCKLLEGAQLVDTEEVSPVARKLAYMNKHYAVLKRPVRVVSVDDPTDVWGFGDFENWYRFNRIRISVQRARGPVIQTTSAAKMWFDNAQRHNVERLVFAPGKPVEVEGNLNIWRGLALEPTSEIGRAQDYWYNTVIRAFGRVDGDRLVNLLAAMVQEPGRKVGRYVFIHGEQGTGKNYIVEPLRAIFGQHIAEPTVQQYLNKFNTLLTAARVILFNEMEEKPDHRDLVQFEAELKVESDTATHQRIIEPKGAERIKVDRHATVIMLSNYQPQWNIRRNDRRGLFLRTWDGMAVQSNGGTKSAKYWEARWSWLSGGGAAEVLAFLMQYPVRWKELEDPAPINPYKEQIVAAASVGNMEVMLGQFLRDPPAELAGVWLIRPADLIRLTYGPTCMEIGDRRIETKAGQILSLNPNLTRERRRLTVKSGPLVFYSISWPQGRVANEQQSLEMWRAYWSDQ